MDGKTSPRDSHEDQHSEDIDEFLLSEHESGFEKTPEISLRKRRKSILIWSIIFHVSILITLGCIWAYLKKEFGQDYLYGVDLISSPARSVIEYENVLMQHDVDVENPFKGPPRPESDNAWDELLQGDFYALNDYQDARFDTNDFVARHSAVLPSELGDRQSSVEINDGTGHVLVELDVFHNLDCLNSIRKYLYRTYYNESTSKAVAHLRQVDTCIDSIRQSLMCHGDIAIGTYVWKKNHLLPWPDFNIMHECRKWDNIQAWAVEHQAPDLSGDMLIHPTFGPAYPEALALQKIPSG